MIKLSLLPSEVLMIIFQFENTYKEIWNKIIKNRFIENAYINKYYKLAIYRPISSLRYSFYYILDTPFNVRNYQPDNFSNEYSVIQYQAFNYRLLT